MPEFFCITPLSLVIMLETQNIEIGLFLNIARHFIGYMSVKTPKTVESQFFGPGARNRE